MQPTVNEVELVQNKNEIPLLRNEDDPSEESLSNVLMAHAGDDSIFNKTEVLAGQCAALAHPKYVFLLLTLFQSWELLSITLPQFSGI